MTASRQDQAPLRRAKGRPSPRAVLRTVLLLALLVFLGMALADRWQEVRPQLGRLSPVAVGGAALAVLSGLWCTFLTWRALLADLGFPLSPAGGARVFFLGQLGKYVPGSVWPALAQMELGRDYRVPARASGAAVIVFMMLTTGVGLLVAVVTIPLLGAAAYGRYLWVLAMLPALLVVLHPRVLNRLLAITLRVIRRDPLPASLTGRGIVHATGWAAGSWVLFGLHAWLLARDLGSTASYLAVTGAFAGALTVGFLLVLAPAGAGVREAVLVLLLSPSMPAGAAVAVAITSRLLFTAGDAAWAALGATAGRAALPHGRSGTPAPRPDA
ncbi:MAG: UPF0104 family protein [Nitriliruptorales bacterium]|nr:UPF0104 family protein [Nitriliruptorales bacterium]